MLRRGILGKSKNHLKLLIQSKKSHFLFHAVFQWEVLRVNCKNEFDRVVPI